MCIRDSFFINSVTEIKAILKQTQLTEDDYRIICADNPKNRRTLEEYTISSSACLLYTSLQPKRLLMETLY